MLETDFTQPLTPPWRVTEIGQGTVARESGLLRLSVPSTPVNVYSDAQISDYVGKRDFRWRPPVRMTVTAHTIPPLYEVGRGLGGGDQSFLRGTAGFGFWNHPFVPGERGFRLPQAVWFFFSSPPNNMKLAKGVPGPGWKAATIDATRWPFLALLPTAPLGVFLMRIPALYNRLWPVGQRAIGVSEHLLDTVLLAESHTYSLDWQADRVTFALDGNIIHITPAAPRGPLGFIAWIDNQYAIVTPQGQFGFGLLPVEWEQTLLIERIRIESL
jgi:hypothetical protein